MTGGSSVAIVGAGFTGTLLAVHMLRHASAPLTIELIDKRREAGRGVAYATRNVSHLLNVRAVNMSAFPDAPCHFVEWLSRRSDLPSLDEPSAAPGYAFVPRGLYGIYLEEQLEEAAAASGPGALLRTRVGSVIDIEQDGSRFAIRLDTGETLRATPWRSASATFHRDYRARTCLLPRTRSSLTRAPQTPW